MPRLSFTSSDNVVRVTPRAAAASVMLKPKGRNALAQHEAAGVRWVLHRHGFIFLQW
jgi:hypothetical protein